MQSLPTGKYIPAEASYEDNDAPPSLHSSEEAVTRMHYSDMDIASAKPANRGTASGRQLKSRKTQHTCLCLAPQKLCLKGTCLV